VWQETTGNITPLKGEKWLYRGTGGHAATLPAAYTVGDSPSEIWLQHNGTGVFSITPASGDNLVVSGVTFAANASYSLPMGTMAILVPGVTNTTWIVTVISMSGGITGLFKTANYTAVAGDIVYVDTSAIAITILLPASPATGSTVWVMDANNNATVNNITVGRNGSTIDGVAADFIIDVNAGKMEFIYSGTTWEFHHDFGVEDTWSEADIIQVIHDSPQYALPPFGSRQIFNAGSIYDGTTPVDFGAFTRVEAAVGGQTYAYRTASGTVDQEGQWVSNLTERGNLEDHGVKFQVIFIPTTTGAGNVKFDFTLLSQGDGDEITAAFPTGVSVLDATQLSTTKVHVSPLSAALTLTPAQFRPGNNYIGRIRRLATDAEDTYNFDVRIIGWIMHWSPMALNDLNGNDF
jgi:hypothetical protein